MKFIIRIPARENLLCRETSITISSTAAISLHNFYTWMFKLFIRKMEMKIVPFHFIVIVFILTCNFVFCKEKEGDTPGINFDIYVMLTHNNKMLSKHESKLFKYYFLYSLQNSWWMLCQKGSLALGHWNLAKTWVKAILRRIHCWKSVC